MSSPSCEWLSVVQLDGWDDAKRQLSVPGYSRLCLLPVEKAGGGLAQHSYPRRH